MVSVLVLKAVDRGFIGGVMVSVLVSKAVDRGFILGGLTFLSRKQYMIYRFREKHANLPPMNP
jgi:hypothetical protein